MMFWRSVVGKLWFTILLLVSVVLLVLTFLLLQSFEQFHTEHAEQELLNHANLMASFLADEEMDEAAFQMSQTIAETYGAKSVIVFEDEEFWYTSHEDIEEIPLSFFIENPELSQVLTTRESAVTQGDYTVTSRDEHDEVMIVGVPVDFTSGEEGAIYLYQPLTVVEEASNQTKQIIYVSAGVAIILTTIFAFFLTTRITAPLRRMRKASLEVAKGNFDAKVPIQTKDEIGLLAIAFNRMARTLHTNLHALSQEKEQLSRILSSMADGVITLDRNGKVMVTNPPAREFIDAWRYDSKAPHGEYPSVLHDLYCKVVQNEREEVAEVMIQGRSWVILMTPLYDNHDVRGAVAVVRDMTEERQHDKLRKDFIANVSHELRTPISMLQGYSEAIVDDIASSDDEKKEFAQIIHDESLRIGRLVNEFLDLARMEAGYIRLEKEPIDVEAFVTKIKRKFQVVAKEQQIELQAYSQHLPKPLIADSDRLEQVVTNLIDNAIRHTYNNGKVYFHIEGTDKNVIIEVVDTGVGIPEADLPFVFERFYKTDKARTRGNAGTGLGLAIVKNLVEAHHGKVAVRSKMNEGTTFTVTLPYETERGLSE
ncbi:HAMP domain-containing protein [Paenalkalicoccus suaedae]|uniref:histidine kinase n=1 Tax=Paenalkalicoccus suaedae TaxID=2592382 RepID=A0A859FCI1_9BACI|nr:ATP-binding protein [Paenalkalicoccus suaedae]QKS71053.1 HAMP domain-containing protein [Paenalkalicoccus suaedae]